MHSTIFTIIIMSSFQMLMLNGIQLLIMVSVKSLDYLGDQDWYCWDANRVNTVCRSGFVETRDPRHPSKKLTQATVSEPSKGRATPGTHSITNNHPSTQHPAPSTQHPVPSTSLKHFLSSSFFLLFCAP